jgi:hypothetical protein
MVRRKGPIDNNTIVVRRRRLQMNSIHAFSSLFLFRIEQPTPVTRGRIWATILVFAALCVARICTWCPKAVVSRQVV